MWEIKSIVTPLHNCPRQRTVGAFDAAPPPRGQSVRQMGPTRRWARTLAFLAVISLVLLPARAAVAALIFDVALVPPNPSVGDDVTVIVTVYTASADQGARGAPFALDEFPWTIQAVAEDGSTTKITLTKGQQPGEWLGHFAFDSPGSWTVGLADEHFGSPADPSFGGSTEVTVRATSPPVGSPASSATWPWFAGGSALIGLTAVWLVRRRRVHGLGSTA